MNWSIIFAALAICNSHVHRHDPFDMAAPTGRNADRWDEGYEQCQQIERKAIQVQQAQAVAHALRQRAEDRRTLAAAAKELRIKP